MCGCVHISKGEEAKLRLHGHVIRRNLREVDKWNEVVEKCRVLHTEEKVKRARLRLHGHVIRRKLREEVEIKDVGCYILKRR
jgi:hypothetical protein